MQETQKSIRRIFIGTLIIIPLVAGLLTFRNYGESLDESHLYAYSDYSLQAYRGFFTSGFDPYLGKGNFRYYGPAFLMATDLFARLLGSLVNGLPKTDAWHLAYFFAFQTSVVGVYFLAKRWLSELAALSTASLFLFQPLLWGHAFINPKDIPFMAFFLLSILTGLVMQERLFPNNTKWDLPDLNQIKQEWNASKSDDRGKVILFFALAVMVLLLSRQVVLLGMVTNFVKTIYVSGPEGVLGGIFSFFAQNYRTIPAEFYVLKALKLVNLVSGIITIFLLGAGISFLHNVFSGTLSFINNRSFLESFKDFFAYFRKPALWFAGSILGLTISVRILGPLAGLIVFMIAFKRVGPKVIPAFIAYSVIAVLVMYLTWPYLWPDPIGHFQTSLVVMSEFPWDGKVLFHGAYYTSDHLPLSYVPLLFGIQFTEPVILLFIIGLACFVLLALKRSVNSEFSLLVIIWGLLPFIVFTVLRPSLYDNFRQLFFIVPPLFLIVGLGVEKLFQYIGQWYCQILTTILFLLPGLFSIIHLHPYQYVYYNSFSDGLRGASRQYEADYWGTSFREAIEYLNQVAPKDAHVIVYAAGNADRVTRFARPDLFIDSSNSTRFDPVTGYDYVIISTRGERDKKNFTDWHILYAVQRDGNVFAIVKQRPVP